MEKWKKMENFAKNIAKISKILNFSKKIKKSKKNLIIFQKKLQKLKNWKKKIEKNEKKLKIFHKKKRGVTGDVGESECEGCDGETGGQGDADGRRTVTRPGDEGSADDEDQEEGRQTLGDDRAPKVQRSDLGLHRHAHLLRPLRPQRFKTLHQRLQQNFNTGTFYTHPNLIQFNLI